MSLAMMHACDSASASRPSTPVITLLDDAAAWNAYVGRHPGAALYHRYEWLTVIRDVFGHEVFPMAATHEGDIVGVFPLALMDSRWFGRFLVSLPFVNYGGIVADSPDVERALWDRAVDLARERGARHLEARHVTAHPFIPQAAHHKVTMVLPLADDVDAQWRQFDAKLRNQIRKAQSSGLTVTTGAADAVPRFYDIFARNMRDLGTPVYSRRLFAAVVAHHPASCRVYLVHRGATVVAAGITLTHGETMEMPWAASRRDALATCPNHSLYWAAIQDAIRSGCRRFDFGRSTWGSGPYKFKRQWGAHDIPLNWEYWTTDGTLPNLSPQNPRYALAVRLWKRLPLGLATRLGPFIVRHIP